MSNFEEMARTNSVAQWIMSLAISIVCCACLFVVLAFYITDQHITVSTVSLRMDLLQQRQDRLTNEIELIRRQVIPSAAGMAREQVKEPVAATPSAAPIAPKENEGFVMDKAVDESSIAPKVPAIVAPSIK